ncbi:hypothetical protein BDQ17DRAFT_1370515 [Cyathus striatus]|nr:hypothetical protein BDQ17DRAFT_1370515 [Cyathus striatus]
MSFYFPPEIEDDIFRWVVLTAPLCPADVHLATVSKNGEILLIEPIFYETLKFRLIEGIIKENSFEFALQSKSPQFFHDSVKNILFIDVSLGFSLRLLKVCTGIRDLGIWSKEYDPIIWDYVTALPLQTLETHLDMLNDLKYELLQVKHLSIIPINFEESLPLVVFPLLPALTHLTVAVGDDNDLLLEDLGYLLKSIEALQSVTILIGEDNVEMNREKRRVRGWKALDPRIQVMRPPHMGIDMWQERVTKGEVDFNRCQWGGYNLTLDSHSDGSNSEGDGYMYTDSDEYSDSDESD